MKNEVSTEALSPIIDRKIDQQELHKSESGDIALPGHESIIARAATAIRQTFKKVIPALAIAGIGAAVEACGEPTVIQQEYKYCKVENDSSPISVALEDFGKERRIKLGYWYRFPNGTEFKVLQFWPEASNAKYTQLVVMTAIDRKLIRKYPNQITIPSGESFTFDGITISNPKSDQWGCPSGEISLDVQENIPNVTPQKLYEACVKNSEEGGYKTAAGTNIDCAQSTAADSPLKIENGTTEKRFESNHFSFIFENHPLITDEIIKRFMEFAETYYEKVTKRLNAKPLLNRLPIRISMGDLNDITALTYHTGSIYIPLREYMGEWMVYDMWTVIVHEFIHALTHHYGNFSKDCSENNCRWTRLSQEALTDTLAHTFAPELTFDYDKTLESRVPAGWTAYIENKGVTFMFDNINEKGNLELIFSRNDTKYELKEGEAVELLTIQEGKDKGKTKILLIEKIDKDNQKVYYKSVTVDQPSYSIGPKCYEDGYEVGIIYSLNGQVIFAPYPLEKIEGKADEYKERGKLLAYDRDVKFGSGPVYYYNAVCGLKGDDVEAMWQAYQKHKSTSMPAGYKGNEFPVLENLMRLRGKESYDPQKDTINYGYPGVAQNNAVSKFGMSRKSLSESPQFFNGPQLTILPDHTNHNSRSFLPNQDFRFQSQTDPFGTIKQQILRTIGQRPIRRISRRPIRRIAPRTGMNR